MKNIDIFGVVKKSLKFYQFTVEKVVVFELTGRMGIFCMEFIL